MEKEKIIETLRNLAEQGYGDDTIWEVIDRLENESDAEEIETLKRFARELKRQQVLDEKQTIELKVEDYCHNCREFEPIAKEVHTFGGCSHLVICENSLKCEAIYKKAKDDLKRQAAEEVKP